ncbi:recombinase-like helix-turn-helix domain-containing protein [Methylobacterium variabile]|jgi:hypothetical protein|uniref:recombinase-like helix-turn-helix domain-containing protein n=1 Tax=Methylobacterium variabile TaxID=298794 RepID=UPI003158EC09
MKTGIDRFAAKGRETSIQVRQERAKRHAAELVPIIEDIQAGGVTTLQAIAGALNDRGIPTARGGSWSAVQVSRVLAWAAQDSGLRTFHPAESPLTGDASRASGRTGVTHSHLEVGRQKGSRPCEAARV